MTWTAEQRLKARARRFEQLGKTEEAAGARAEAAHLREGSPMPEVTTEVKADAPKIVHPDLAPQKRVDTGSKKQRRTTVRMAKLVNPYASEERGRPIITQVPIEPSHNNHGSYDAGGPLRHYLNKGFVFPHDYDPEKFPFLYCAVKDCWEKAVGDERCPEHEDMWQKGLIRYATVGKAPAP